MNRITVILPSLNPDEKILEVVRSCIDVGFSDIVIVNDGSDSEHLHYFEKAAEYPEVTVLTHEVNRGKGAAMKTAFQYVMKNRPELLGVVTVDGDNQHKAADILRCVEKMLELGDHFILGVRDFDLPIVPKRSRTGNKLTSFVFRTGVGLKISDTQTGLRAIPAKYIPCFIKTRGDRYEYETNQLLDLKVHDIPFAEVKIETVYIEENATSHFQPVRDSIRIYGQILKFMASSGLSCIIDFSAFRLFLWVFSALGGAQIYLATAVSRIISSLCNFLCNRKLVFSSKSGLGRTLLRYYCLCIPQLLVSAGLVKLLTLCLHIDNDWLTTLVKLPVDVILFFISYKIQQVWVFRKTDRKMHI